MANELPTLPILRPGLLIAQLSNVRIVLLEPSISPEDYQMHVELFVREIRARQGTQRIATLYDIPEPVPVTAQQRKILADVLNEHSQKLAKTATAFVLSTSSAVARGHLQAVFWQAPPPYPHAIVESSSAGFAFIAQHMEGLDVVDLERRYHQLRARMRSMTSPAKSGSLRGG